MASEGQYQSYLEIIDKIEKTQAEYVAGQEKLIDLNIKLRDLFLELKHASQKFNSQKPLKNNSTLMED